MTPLDQPLRELAHAHGVVTDFGDWRGGAAQASAEAVVAVLAAIGVDARSPQAVAESLRAASDAAWRRMLPAYVVVRGGHGGRVAVHVPHGEPVELGVEFEADAGRRVPLRQLMVWVDPREVDGALVGEATFEIADDLPLGYHTLHAASGPRHETALLLVVPDRIELPRVRAWGLMLQLYAVRSRASWGIGDLRDLADLVAASGHGLGAGFTLVNPLHAAEPVPPLEPSPYFPSSRQFVNPLYLRVEDVPEVAELPVREVAEVAAPVRTADLLRAAVLADALLDRDAVWSAKRRVLQAAFARRREPRHEAAFAAFTAHVEAQGRALADFATWCALADVHGPAWQDWPVDLRDPRSDAVARFRTAHAELVEFHAWLQWQCERQLDAVQAVAREVGMPVGVLHDLAVGASPHGADAWALQRVLARGVTMGAPADMYNQQGQRWNLPPWHPRRLAEDRFEPFRALVRSWLRRGGGLRIDHVIGLFRQWWVRDGATPADGAYLRLDHEALLGIVLLEAHRAGALVIGEDLGVVEPWVREHLRERGVLGTSVLWFEHEADGAPLPPDRWRELCLATVTTHDLPPSAGYLTGVHVELRARLGLLERDVDSERAADEAERLDWLHALAGAGVLDPAVVTAVASGRGSFGTRIEPHLDAVLAALHRYLVRTPATLVGIYLPDLVGDRRPVNQPGTVDQYPNWRVPMADGRGRPVLLDDVLTELPGLLERRVAGHVAPWLGLVAASLRASVTVASSVDQPS